MESTDTPTLLPPSAAFKPRRTTSRGKHTMAQPELCMAETSFEPLESELAHQAFARILSAHHALQKKITQLSFTDSLTGLKNRPALLISLQRAIDKSHESQSYAAVLLVDIDDFKSHNVHLGHLAGDMLLQQSARRMSQTLGPEVAVARLFADKFIVVLEGLGATAEEAGMNAQRIATGINDCFAEAFDTEASSVHLSVSMGLCLIGVQDTISTDVLIDRAELVTYNAKQAGGGCMFSFEFGSMEHAA